MNTPESYEFIVPDMSGCLDLTFESPQPEVEAALALAMLPERDRAIWRDNLGVDEETIAKAGDRFFGIARHLPPNPDFENDCPLARWQAALLENRNLSFAASWERFPKVLHASRFRNSPMLSDAWNRHTRSRPEARERQREAKKRYNARPEIKTKNSEKARQWRKERRSTYLAEPWLAARDEKRNAHYHRPFVAIDSEGQNYEGQDRLYNGVIYPRHSSFLWGAMGVERIAPPDDAIATVNFAICPCNGFVMTTSAR